MHGATRSPRIAASLPRAGMLVQALDNVVKQIPGNRRRACKPLNFPFPLRRSKDSARPEAGPAAASAARRGAFNLRAPRPAPMPMSTAAAPRAFARSLRDLRLALAQPLYLGLIVAQGVYVFLFLKELWHLVHDANSSTNRGSCCWCWGSSTWYDLQPAGDGDRGRLRDLRLAPGLQGHPDQPEWLSHVNASVLKVKLAMAIIGSPRSTCSRPSSPPARWEPVRQRGVHRSWPHTGRRRRAVAGRTHAPG